MADRPSNVVLNFKMSGQVEYAKTIRDINAIMNAAASEYRTHVAAMGKDAEATQKLAAEKKKLEIQLEGAQQRTKMLRTEYEAMAKDTNTSTGQLANKYKQLQNSERAEIALSNALDRVNQGLTEQAEESRKAQDSLRKLEVESSTLESQTEKLNAEYRLQTAQLGENASETEKLKLKMEHLNDTHELAREKVENYEKQLEQAKLAYGENSSEVDKYETQLLEARTAEQQLANEIGATNKQLREQESVLKKTSDQLKATGDKMKDVGKDLSMKVTAPIVGLGTVAAKTAIDFESSFADVRKTVDETEGGFQRLEEGIREMSKELPSAASEIAQVTAMAGQLGIQNEHLMTFTRTMIDLGVATDMHGEEAATTLARLANITNMSQENFDRLGATIVDLGNNFAATEGEIAEMALRIAGAGSQIKMSEADILGFATALTSVGINAEAGGTAISKLMIEMANDVDQGGDRLKEFARVAGMSVEDFRKAFEEDAATAIFTFLGGLGDLSEQGESAFAIIDELGLSEIRLRDTILRTSNAREMANEALATANNAWEENTALTEEAEERYKTTESQLIMLKNAITDVAIDIGNILIPMIMKAVDAIKPWVDRFKEMDESSQRNIVMISGLVAAIGPLLMIFGSIAKGAGTLIAIFKAISGALTVVTSGAAAATPAIGGLARVITLFTGPVGLAIGALTALGFGLSALVKYFREPAIEAEIFSDEISEATQKAVGAYLELDEQASVALKQLAWSQRVVTEEMANDLVATYDEMGSQILTKMEEDHAEQLALTEQLLANTREMSNEERAKVIEDLHRHQDEEKQVIENGQARIKEILERTKEEKRALSDSEQREINSIQHLMKENAVKYMSDSEVEQKVILENLKNEASKITAEQAAEVVKNSLQQKEEVVKEANEQYNETIANIIRLRDEAGVISEEQAKKLIEEAEWQRDEVVKNAEQMHERVIREAQNQAKEHINLIDWETGEVLTKWDIFTREVVEITDTIYEKASENFGKMYKSIVGFMTMSGEDVREKMEEIRESIESKWKEAQRFLENIDLKEVGRNIMQGLVNGIESIPIVKKVKEVADGITNTIRERMKIHSPSRVMRAIGRFIAQGLGLGIEDKKSYVDETAERMASSVVKITDKMEKEIQSITTKSNAEIAKIEKRAQEDINLIHIKAKQAKRSLTQAEIVRIRRLEEDSAKKVRDIESKLSKDVIKIKENHQKEIDEIYKKEFERSKKWIDDRKYYNELSLGEELAAWERVQARYIKGSKEREEADRQVYRVRMQITDQLNKLNDDYLKQVQDVNQKLIDEEKRLTDEYQKAYDSRVSAIVNFAGIFDEFSTNFEGSGRTLLRNLQSQVEGLEEWSDVLASLGEKIDDEQLMKELEGLGPNALGELKALNSLSESELERYVKLYNQKFNLAREQAEAELVGMKEDTEYQISEMRRVANKKLGELHSEWVSNVRKITQTTSDEFKTLTSIGRQAGQNLLDGLTSMEGALIAKARSIARAVNAAMSSALDGGGRSVNTMTIDTQWNAKGAIFTQPTIFGASGGKLQGAGEAGPEAVLPLNDETLGAIGKGIAKTMAGAEINIYSRDDAESIARAVDRAYRQISFKMG